MISKEEIEKAKEMLSNPKKEDLIEIIRIFKRNGIENYCITKNETIETLLQYIEQLEQENNKQNEGSFEFKISEKSAKKLHKMVEPLENAYNRFENGEETLDDLLKYYPSFKIQFKYNDGKQNELDVVEKKYYKKLVDIINKLNKMIDEMSKEINRAYFDENNFCLWFEKYITKEKSSCLSNRIKIIKQYFEKKVEEK